MKSYSNYLKSLTDIPPGTPPFQSSSLDSFINHATHIFDSQLDRENKLHLMEPTKWLNYFKEELTNVNNIITSLNLPDNFSRQYIKISEKVHATITAIWSEYEKKIHNIWTRIHTINHSANKNLLYYFKLIEAYDVIDEYQRKIVNVRKNFNDQMHEIKNQYIDAQLEKNIPHYNETENRTLNDRIECINNKIKNLIAIHEDSIDSAEENINKLQQLKKQQKEFCEESMSITSHPYPSWENNWKTIRNHTNKMIDYLQDWIQTINRLKNAKNNRDTILEITLEDIQENVNKLETTYRNRANNDTEFVLPRKMLELHMYKTNAELYIKDTKNQIPGPFLVGKINDFNTKIQNQISNIENQIDTLKTIRKNEDCIAIIKDFFKEAAIINTLRKCAHYKFFSRSPYPAGIQEIFDHLKNENDPPHTALMSIILIAKKALERGENLKYHFIVKIRDTRVQSLYETLANINNLNNSDCLRTQLETALGFSKPRKEEPIQTMAYPW